MVSPRGPTKIRPAAFDGVGESRVLGKEAIAGMDGVGAGRARRGDDGGDVEIGFGGLRRPDVHGGVGQLCTASESASAEL